MTGLMGMSEDAFKIPLQARVRLKGDRADIYPRAYGGAEAVVKKHSLDPIGGYPMVFVEWDKNHWTYQGERDMWTFEDHFDIVEDEKPPPPEPPAYLQPHHPVAPTGDNLKAQTKEEHRSAHERDPVRRMVERAQDRHNRERIQAAQQEPPSSDSPNQDDYMKALSDALEEASNGEAFLVISVARKSSPLNPDVAALVPHVDFYYLSDEAGLILESQLSEIATASHTELALNRIREILKDKYDGNR